MSERERYLPGVPCWTDVNTPDPLAAAEFYGGLFGWELEDGMPEGSGSHYLMARLRGRDVAAISSLPEAAPPTAAWNTYVAVEDADAAAHRAAEAGGTVLVEPFDVMDAGRMAVLADPEGAVLCVWQARANPGAKVVNEHGAVNFNGLACRDVAAAERFYGALFGWKLLHIPGGAMWGLPGYADHLEELTPGLKAQMEGMAPDGFLDVVAQVQPIAEGDADTSPHWNVTFATDDVEATAARARELGGEVLHGPVDAPWVRMAVIRDPQGASFIAAQFVPENAVTS